jgi:hypothetical protein
VTLDGPAILVRTMSVVRPFGKRGYRGQYHSQSDHHSKVACWGIMFDLLQESALLRKHAAAGKVIIGVNHEMRDFKAQRKKNLDLVIATPGTVDLAEDKEKHTFAELGAAFEIELDAAEQARLDALPDVARGPVGSVLLALEAKACMTAHIKALPRLYDELNSSHLTVHGAADQAVAAGLAMVNVAKTFLSPKLNPLGLKQRRKKVSVHKQPDVAVRTIDKLRELPRRNKPGDEGFDALGIIVVDCANDGSPVTLVTTPPAPGAQDDYRYDQMVRRAASQYAYRFASL